MAIAVVEIGTIGKHTYFFRPYSHGGGRKGVVRSDDQPWNCYQADVTEEQARGYVWQVAERHLDWGRMYNAVNPHFK